MQQFLILIVFVALGIALNGCHGLPYGLPQEDDPEQYMTGMTHPPGYDHTMDHTMPPMDHGSMKMWFHASVHNTILFEKWHTMEWWELLLSCIAVAVMGCLYEGFKVLRESLARKSAKSNKVVITPATSNGKMADSTTMMIEQDVPAWSASLMSTSHIVQSLLHFVQLFFSFSLMLIFMTYSCYLCIALCLGGAVGYFLFAYKRDYQFDNEHCN